MTYEQVRKRIGELVPDVIKLDKNTCVCGHDITSHEYIPTFSTIEAYRSSCFHCICRMFKVSKIIDPSLADVLRAIGKDLSSTTEMSFIGGDVVFVSVYNIVGERTGTMDWDLSKPLSGQSQETLDFIGEILK